MSQMMDLSTAYRYNASMMEYYSCKRSELKTRARCFSFRARRVDSVLSLFARADIAKSGDGHGWPRSTGHRVSSSFLTILECVCLSPSWLYREMSKRGAPSPRRAHCHGTVQIRSCIQRHSGVACRQLCPASRAFECAEHVATTRERSPRNVHSLF